MAEWHDEATADNYRTDANLRARMRLFEFLVEGPEGFPPTESFNWAPGARVLDVGCGTGMWLGAVLGRAGEPVGLDLSPAMLDATRAAQPTVPVVRAGAVHLPFADSSFDVVLALFMLYHVTDKRGALLEFRRVLRDGGRVIACTNDTALRTFDDMACDAIGEVTGHRPDEWYPPLDFNAANGAEILGGVFENVDTLHYRERFEVTDPEVVTGHVASMASVLTKLNPGIDVDAVLAGVHRRAVAEIAARGFVEIIAGRARFVAW